MLLKYKNNVVKFDHGIYEIIMYKGLSGLPIAFIRSKFLKRAMKNIAPLSLWKRIGWFE